MASYQISRVADSRNNAFTSGFIRAVSVPPISSVNPAIKFAYIIAEFPEVTGLDQSTPGSNNDMCHHIVTEGPLVAERPKRLNQDKLKAAKAEFKRLVDLGICEPSNSPWASPIYMVHKKDGSWRICGDYRRLNAITVPDKFPVPHLHDCSFILRGKTVFSKLDLRQAYNQIPVAKEDIPKTLVITPFGLFKYKCMTYGLRNASQTFQRYIFRALGDLEFVFAFIDDILIASESPEEHEKHLRIVLQRLKEFHLRLNTEKCQFDLPDAATIQAPLNEYLCDSRKNDKRVIAWTSIAEEAFSKCKDALANAIQVSHPSDSAETRLVCDASDFAMGAVLEQRLDDSWKPLTFFSRKFSTFTTRIEYLSGSNNVVADSLSRVESIRLLVDIELNELAQQQELDRELKSLLENRDRPLSLKRIQWGPTHTTLYCEMTGEAIRPFSRWPVAVPLQDIEAVTVAQAFYDNWITNFGTPQTLTTD
ncbi:uncharacterized protein [Mycetomoellerius zeteki]|uniref:uncharacterized protein n=1 Tax=Mycetomoellerius zeteki TaxID=64791 RepID=UPI00084E58D2|nr:PREDICTED: uncharacterized protein LOC108722190 [Trachymyrmex zeteki]